jgi:RNA polymerase sigma-70 factor (sigma-E family)
MERIPGATVSLLVEGVRMSVGPPAGTAFTDFVARSYVALVRTGYLLTGDRGHAEDLVQQCLMTTYRSWDRLDTPASAEAYTRTSMVRQAVRWRSRRWRDEIPVAEMPQLPVGDRTADVELADRVRQALMTLPASQRAVLVLRFFDDLPEAEVATILRCSVGTVKSRASRALRVLRRRGLLEEREAEGSSAGTGTNTRKDLP